MGHHGRSPASRPEHHLTAFVSKARGLRAGCPRALDESRHLLCQSTRPRLLGPFSVTFWDTFCLQSMPRADCWLDAHPAWGLCFRACDLGVHL